MKSRFAQPAEDELAEAVDHYDQITTGLGDRFLADARQAVRLIEEFPHNSPVVTRQVRRKVLLEFPYSLFYIVAPDEVVILAVAHQKRRPLYWKRRIPKSTGR
jgi:plasmid stabilization system protein ParE